MRPQWIPLLRASSLTAGLLLADIAIAQPSSQATRPQEQPVPAPAPAPLVAPAPAAPLMTPPRERRYTAQVRPKVAVMKFENTNELAKKQGFGESVSAMLVTFLKSKSQLVMIERQSLEAVLESWKLTTTGATTTLTADDRLLLDEIDGIIQGKVTVLERQDDSSGKTRTVNEVEIDATLIDRQDAHIIAAAHQSGNASCLRQIVGSLGIELEQGMLKPFYGELNVTVSEPSNIRIYLSPILSNRAKADERPAVTLGATANGEEGGDKYYVHWITSPHAYVIRSLLSGWYTVSLQHPGYAPAATENAKYEVRDPEQFPDGNPTHVGSISPANDPLIVYVAPGTVTDWSPDGKGVKLRKLGNTIAIRVKPEFTNKFRDAADLPELRTLLMASDLRLNDWSDTPKKEIDNNGCPTPAERVEVNRSTPPCERKSGQEQVFESLSGPFVIEDYHRADSQARLLPLGEYSIRAGMPGYETSEAKVSLASGPELVLEIPMKRLRGELRLAADASGMSDSTHKIYIEGARTGTTRAVPLVFRESSTNKDGSTGQMVTIPALPYETYTLRTDLSGWEKWRRQVTIGTEGPVEVTKPDSGPDGKAEPCSADLTRADIDVPAGRTGSRAPLVQLKTQMWIAGDESMHVARADRIPVLHVIEEILALSEKASAEAAAKSAGPAQQAFTTHRPKADNRSSETEQMRVLRDELRDADLIYLNDEQMKVLSRNKGLAQLIHEYVDNGGVLYCFVSSPQDYSGIFGDSGIVLENEKAQKGVFELRPGDLSSVRLDIKTPLPQKDSFPILKTPDRDKAPQGWTVLAKRGKREPGCILEKGDPESGTGYVIVWLDSPEHVAKFPSGPDVLALMDQRALAAAEASLFHRLDPSGELARETLARYRSQKIAKTLER